MELKGAAPLKTAVGLTIPHISVGVRDAAGT
jgi:hypothetical protein